ncbi:MAG: PE family protein, partial [Mycobacterium sp.]
MSFLMTVPDALSSAATDLADIGSTLNHANTAAALPTTGILAAAEDEVSAAIAALFSKHGAEFQSVSAQAAAFHDRFVLALTASKAAYGSSEAANASPLQAVLNVINAPFLAATGRPLIGNGANGKP